MQSALCKVLILILFENADKIILSISEYESRSLSLIAKWINSLQQGSGKM